MDIHLSELNLVCKDELCLSDIHSLGKYFHIKSLRIGFLVSAVS